MKVKATQGVFADRFCIRSPIDNEIKVSFGKGETAFILKNLGDNFVYCVSTFKPMHYIYFRALEQNIVRLQEVEINLLPELIPEEIVEDHELNKRPIKV